MSSTGSDSEEDVEWDLQAELVCFLKDRLFFTAPREIVDDDAYESKYTFFRPDKERVLLYDNFNRDFGPPNLAALTCFCRVVDYLIAEGAEAGRAVVVISEMNRESIANNVLFICSYLMLYHGMSIEDVLKPSLDLYPPVARYCDAGYIHVSFELSLKDVLSGLHRAVFVNKWFDPRTFDVDKYLELEKPLGLDANVVIPNRLIAFASPGRYRKLGFYVKNFQEHFEQISAVVRFNLPMYNSRGWGKSITFKDLYYEDGTTPPKTIIHRFFRLYDTTPGWIAVHCKSGLGRTGSLIGCVLMRDYEFTAREAIGWLRLCRPGSVLGEQQDWLVQNEKKFQERGVAIRKGLAAQLAEETPDTPPSPLSPASPIPSAAKLLLRRKKHLRAGTKVSPSPSRSKTKLAKRKSRLDSLLSWKYRQIVLSIPEDSRGE